MWFIIGIVSDGAMCRGHTDGEVVIMLAFQASGTGSIPVRCTPPEYCTFLPLVFLDDYSSLVALNYLHCLALLPAFETELGALGNGAETYEHTVLLQ